MTRPKKQPTAKKAASKPQNVAPVPFETKDANVAYRHFTPIVRAEVPAEQAEVLRADVQIVRTNIERGVDAIRPHLDLIRTKAPTLALHLVLELPALALGLIVATDRVVVPVSDGEIQQRLEKLRPMRELTLLQLEVLVEMGLAPRDRVAAIRAGKGPLDSARDGVAIAGLFEELSASIAGKHPFSPAYLSELAEHANWLLVRLKPGGAAATPSERPAEAILRDQFWTAVSRRHELLREAGVAAFGLKRLDEMVLPLGSRVVASAAAAPAAAPAVTPAIAPETQPTA